MPWPILLLPLLVAAFFLYRHLAKRRQRTHLLATPLTAQQRHIVEQLGVTAEEVVVEASFIDDLGADSLDIVELVMAIEEVFSLEIPDEEAERLQTIQDAISYVEERTSKE